MMDLLDIGGAHATGGDANEDVGAADAGDFDFLQAEVVDAAVDDGLHERGQGLMG